jgi:hypothetical protein
MTSGGNGSKKLKFKRRSKNVPLIQMGVEFEKRSEKDKLMYFWKLASSLDYAAKQIQKERNELNTLLFKKEKQLTAYKKQLAQDRQMIQKQLMAENKTKQKLLDENQELRLEIKRLENANNNKLGS